MKTKILILFFFALLVMGCSNDSDSDNQNVAPANSIKKISEKVYYNSEILSDTEATFHYANNQLSYILDGTDKGEFIYSGDKITEYKYYKNNVLHKKYAFTYDSNNQVISIISDDLESRSIYQYTNGNVSKIREQEFNGTTWEDFSTNDYIFNSSNNLVQEIESIYGWGNYTAKFSYEYDNKNNPFKSMNKYLKYIFGFESVIIYANNNYIKRYNYPSVTSTEATLDINSVIVYNSNDYPISIKKYWVNNGQNGSLLSEMTIEYN